MKVPQLQTDSWVWGTETIVWGSSPSHHYTCKLLRPKVGRAGCMSLQYHHEKSETWIVYEGAIWALVVSDGVVCTRIMRKGAIQNLPVGTIHRLMGLTDDALLIEPSTPDRHAADKSVPKDVVRLHCFFGRPVEAPRSGEERIIERAVEVSLEAIQCFEQGKQPPEYEFGRLVGAYSIG